MNWGRTMEVTEYIEIIIGILTILGVIVTVIWKIFQIKYKVRLDNYERVIKKLKQQITDLTGSYDSEKLSNNISWRDINKAFKKLEPEIRDIKPDVVVGLADGRITGAIIVANLCIPSFYTIDIPIEHDKKGHRITNIIGEIGNIEDKHVLLVDNHIYTGINMEAARNHLCELGAKEITTLVFFKHEVGATASRIDHFAYVIKGNRKVMPWSYTREHDSRYQIELSSK